MKSKSILGMTIILIVILAFAIGCAGSQADYQMAYDAGYDAGYSEGHEDGYVKGTVWGMDLSYDTGYAEGYIDCQAEQAVEETELPPSEPETFEPITITGAGLKTSQPFEITTDEWNIEWSYSTDYPEWAYLWFDIYPRGETVMPKGI